MGMTPAWLFNGWLPIILSDPILILAPPLGTLEILWIMRGIAFLHRRQILEESLIGIS